MTDRKKQRYFCVLIIIWAALFLTSCAPIVIEPAKICPGRKTATQAILKLKSQWQNSEPFKATGQCKWEGYDEKGVKRKENFAVRLWLQPPDNFCLHGDVFFNSSGIVLGANASEFWLTAKPKEIRGYFWGQRDIDDVSQQLLIGPENLFEALGAVKVSNTNTVLSNRLGFDILTKKGIRNLPLKKIFINTCSYLVKRIEYFDNAGRLRATAEMDDHKKLTEGFFVPRRIKINRIDQAGKNDIFLITLNSVNLKEIKPKARHVLFNRPDTAGFEMIMKFAPSLGRFIEEKP